MKDKWTLKDQDLAYRQGWGVFETNSGVQILKLDDPASVENHQASVERFPSDESAVAYVVGRADMGDEHAARALKHHHVVSHSIGSLDEFEYLIG